MKFIPLLCLIPLLTLPLHAQDTAEKAREMTSNLEKIESLIDKTIKELREAVEQLTRISTESDKPRDAFEDFTDQLKDYKDVQSTLAERIDHFRSIADTRFADWEKDLAKMEGDLKAISQTRMNKAKKEYSDIDKKVRTIGAKLTKAVDKLQEVQTYFTTELNSASIQAASKVTDAAKKSADDVMQTLEGMKADYRQLKADTSENSAKSKD
jgi:predicted  nucleic acid-binding Zn-ribbon protein